MINYKDNCLQIQRQHVIAANTDITLEGNEKQTETRGTAISCKIRRREVENK